MNKIEPVKMNELMLLNFELRLVQAGFSKDQWGKAERAFYYYNPTLRLGFGTNIGHVYTFKFNVPGVAKGGRRRRYRYRQLGQKSAGRVIQRILKGKYAKSG